MLVSVVYEDISYEYTPHYEDIMNYEDRASGTEKKFILYSARIVT